ncbi:MAG: TerB family tellurite resistance protein [bacterium]|nr:TerB family tellurite resistance protein [bacterium]
MDKHKRALIKGLVHMMWADGVIEEHEREFMGSVLAELGCSHAEMAEVAQMMMNTPPTTEDFDFDADTFDMDEREEILRTAIAMAMVDGIVAKQEKKMVMDMADSLGIPEAKVKELMDRTRQDVTSMRSVEDE